MCYIGNILCGSRPRCATSSLSLSLSAVLPLSPSLLHCLSLAPFLTLCWLPLCTSLASLALIFHMPSRQPGEAFVPLPSALHLSLPPARTHTLRQRRDAGGHQCEAYPPSPFPSLPRPAKLRSAGRKQLRIFSAVCLHFLLYARALFFSLIFCSSAYPVTLISQEK